jgi:AmiR/NasT family two-component response regulator
VSPARESKPAQTSAAEIRAVLGRVLSITEASYERQAHLERALRSRIVIEQAKGVLRERFRLSIEEAFELLRRAARSSRASIHELSAEVVASDETPPAIEDALAGSRRRR